jgi:hypothetical protein
MYIFQPARNEHQKKIRTQAHDQVVQWELDKLCISCSQDQFFYINSCNSTKILTLIIIIQISTDIPWFSTNSLYVHCTSRTVCMYIVPPEQFVQMYVHCTSRTVCMYIVPLEQFVCTLYLQNSLYVHCTSRTVCMYIVPPEQFVCTLYLQN